MSAVVLTPLFSPNRARSILMSVPALAVMRKFQVRAAALCTGSFAPVLSIASSALASLALVTVTVRLCESASGVLSLSVTVTVTS